MTLADLLIHDDDLSYQAYLGTRPNLEEYRIFWRRMDETGKTKLGAWRPFDSQTNSYEGRKRHAQLLP